MPDVCVMAVSSLWVVSEFQGDTASHRLWRDPGKQKTDNGRRGEPVSEGESAEEKEAESSHFVE